MAERLLKKKPRKVALGRARSPNAPQPAVIVGTYKEKQLAWIKRHGIYNYPVREEDFSRVERVEGERGTGNGRAQTPAAPQDSQLATNNLQLVKELWLYADVKGTRHVFEAEFVGIKTRDELVAEYGYPAGTGNGEWGTGNGKSAKNGRAVSPRPPKSHGSRYYVFKTKLLEYGSRLDDPIVIARTADFGGRSAKVKRAIEQFKKDGEFAPLTHYLPSDLSKVPRSRLRVCEAAVQMDFLRDIDMSQTEDIVNKISSDNQLSPNDARLTCLDFFAGSGLVSAGLSSDFRTVWANDISQKKALVFNANNQEGVLQVCPIENVSGSALPAVDLSWGSFPCQDLSLAGDIKGLYASRSGLFWQWLRVMDEMAARPPVVVAENVVGLVSAAEGKYYVAVHNELVKRGYSVGAVMLDAANWLPQSRKRIFVIGVKKGVDIRELRSSIATWCHPEPVVKVARKVDDWIWWKIPQPEFRKPVLDEIVDFDSPCDSAAAQLHKLSLVAKEKIDMLKELSRGCRRAFTGYRRTRNHKQVLEVRTDGMAGCLRTPCGGSSRQILIIADDGKLRTRLLTVRETARLMGAPDSYMIPGSYNDGYMAMGDAVAVPVVEYLSSQLLAPLSKAVKVKG